MTQSLVTPMMLCAWCARHGRAEAAAKDPATGEWYALPHSEAHARWSSASHGICTWCCPLLMAAWGIPPEYAAVHQASPVRAASTAHASRAA